MSTSHRLDIIDFWRGLAVIGMIIYHIVFDLEFTFGIGLNLIDSYLFERFADIVLVSFLLLVGFSTYIIYNRSAAYSLFISKQFKRILLTFVSAFIVSVATYIFDKAYFVFFGVLHLITISMIVLLFLARYRRTLLIVSLLIFVVTHYVGAYNNLFFNVLGLGNLNITTFDFVPVFPWLAFPFLGFVFGDFILNFAKWLNPYFSGKFGFVLALGRNSLKVYILHQPLVLALLYFVFFIYRLFQ